MPGPKRKHRVLSKPPTHLCVASSAAGFEQAGTVGQWCGAPAKRTDLLTSGMLNPNFRLNYDE